MTRATAAETAWAESGREYYPIRPTDVLAVAGFWAFLAFISSVSRQLDPRIPGIPEPMVAAVVRSTYVEYTVWAVLSIAILWLATRFNIEGGRRLGRVVVFVVLGIAVAMLVDRVLLELRATLMSDLVGGRLRRRASPPLVGLGFLDDLMVYFAVLGAGITRDYFLRYRARLEETSRLQAQLAQARLDVLRSQINPHFLFNTLNAVSALVERDPRGVRRMIARLSDLLRYTLEESTDQEVPLHRELDLLGEYVELMQIRFQGKLHVAVHTADDAREALVPNLILQPIVENAMKHGVSRVSGAGAIEVDARRADGDLVIIVRDNGPGPAGGPSGVGLSNTSERLRQMYGDRYGVELRAGPAGGTEAVVTLPYHTTPRTVGAGP